MVGAVAGVVPLTDDDAPTNDDGADHRVRRRLSPSQLCEVERPAHERALTRVHGRRLAVLHRY
jgi:hypothetical protein